MTITTDTPVGSIASEAPLSTRVFARHGIDYCCGGGRPLGEVCAEKGLEPDSIVSEIESELQSGTEPSTRWDTAPLDQLIDHILKVYHEPLWEELDRLEAMAVKVHQVHGEKQPEMLTGIVDVFTALKFELDQHMRKEEDILFPMIKGGQGEMAGPPVQVMKHEHETAGEALRRLRLLTDNYNVPEGACNTWRALWHGLAALEKDLHEHIHLENNILFPRALSG
ncbi:MAG: iron-sulfur cluster repair di-iron protein [Planctomycetes bacterium]|nr:iron-sulfur cluster repair di-iron protein [Planctomycetota bacterium]